MTNPKVMSLGVKRWFLLPCLNEYNSKTPSISEELAPFLDESREPRGDGKIAAILGCRTWRIYYLYYFILNKLFFLYVLINKFYAYTNTLVCNVEFIQALCQNSNYTYLNVFL